MKKFIVKLEAKHNTALPVIYNLLSSFLFASTALMIKLLHNVPPTQVLYIRSLLTMIVLKFIIGDSVDCYPKKYIPKLQMRGILGGVGGIAWFWAVKLIQSSEVIVISRISPLWTALIAAYITKTDKLTKKLIIIIILCIIGVILIARPPFLQKLFFAQEDHDSNYSVHLLGIILAFTSSLSISIIQVIISSLAKQVDQLAILQYFSFYTILMPSLFQLIIGMDMVVPTTYEWFILILNSLSGGLAQFFMNRGFILGKLNKMSLVGQSQILFSYLFDIFILNESLNTLSVIGSILVCGCLISVIV